MQTTSTPKHQNVVVVLTGKYALLAEGDTYAATNRVEHALEGRGHYRDAKNFREAAVAGGWEHVLATARQFVTVR